MNQSIINHLFLPHNLPSNADNDFLLRNNHSNESSILGWVQKYLISFAETHEIESFRVFSVLNDCIANWFTVQNPQGRIATTFKSAIEKLTEGYFLPIYFHAQNAAILIEIEQENIRQALVSSWQVLLPTADITSSFAPHCSSFPVKTYRLKDRSQLISEAHCDLLMDFMLNTIEYSASYKASRQVAEIRDVPESHYVCQWWIQQFQGIEIDNNFQKSVEFKKKHRDQIRWNNALLPFRRSGLWMTIKVTFQIILTKRLGQIGTKVYKLLIADFLTHVIGETHSEISMDLLVHCIRKVVRRMDKIENQSSPYTTYYWKAWIQMKKNDIRTKIQQVMPKSDWQNHIRIKQKENQNSLLNFCQSNASDIFKHSCAKLNNYLKNNESSSTLSSFSPSVRQSKSKDVDQEDYIPTIEEFTAKTNYTMGMALTRIEIWVEQNLHQWINRCSSSPKERNHFEILLRFFENYQSEVLKYYCSTRSSSDPIGYSRFILTCLTIIRCMHQKLCNDSRFGRLRQHSISIPNLMRLFEYLVLPSREDMMRIHDLHQYFNEFSSKKYPDLLSSIDSNEAFGIHYDSQSTEMNESIRKIRAQAELDKQAKIREVKEAKERYTRLMDSIRTVSCSCTWDVWYGKQTCSRCLTEKEASSIQVKIFEAPLPSESHLAHAVIFELQMPIEIRSYREVFWQFVNRLQSNLEHGMHEWLKVPPTKDKLWSYDKGPSDTKVKLVSRTKSATQTHYSNPPSIATAPIEDFLHECSLKVQISPTSPIAFENECVLLTPQLNQSDYKELTFTIQNTEFLQNAVIAKLSKCPIRMKPGQFVEFGSFRSGHLLQWWNLLAVLETDSLPISEESVAILIIHSILQYGPLTNDQHSFSHPWCSESHQQLLEDEFVDELVAKLNRYLNDCELNWQNEMVLLVVTIITMRILTICNGTPEGKVAEFAKKCRQTAEKWIVLISQALQSMDSSALDEAQQLRLKMVTISISWTLTFFTFSNRMHLLLSSGEHIVSLLKAVTTLHDNTILGKDQSNMNVFIRNMMRISEYALVKIQSTVAKILQETCFQGLNDFALIYWAALHSKGIMDGRWTKRDKAAYDGWYDCQYESRHLSINCVRGIFLIDGMPLGALPENMTSSSLFQRVFGNHIFEVQLSTSPKTYVTKHTYHGDRHVQYEFYLNENTKDLIITERHISTKKEFQLIPHSLFETDLPHRFAHEYSHWLDKEEQLIEFRPIEFNHAEFLCQKSFELSLVTGYVLTTDRIDKQKLVNQSSGFFETLFHQYFERLDNKPYVFIMRENSSNADNIFHICLSRLGIAFKYSDKENIITSREYSDMCIDQDQWFGTLTGLQSGLLLSPLSSNQSGLNHYPYKKLIIPFGETESKTNQSMNHQSVTVNRPSTISFSNKYFVFILNDRLKILQSTLSPEER